METTANPNRPKAPTTPGGAPVPASATCCSAEEKTTCCEPSAKSACCGEPKEQASGCGCR